MKQFIFILTLLIFTGALNSCGDLENKKENINKNKQEANIVVYDEVEERKQMTDTININWVKPSKETYRDLTNAEIASSTTHTINSAHPANVYSTTSDIINLNIPVIHKNMKVIGATNVSSDNLNAIVIHLDGNGGRPTKYTKPTIMLGTEFSLMSLFKESDKAKLENDKKIIIKILHDDNRNTTDKMTVCFEDCIDKKMQNYNDYEKNCGCDQKTKPLDDEPKEVNGGILKGGR